MVTIDVTTSIDRSLARSILYVSGLFAVAGLDASQRDMLCAHAVVRSVVRSSFSIVFDSSVGQLTVFTFISICQFLEPAISTSVRRTVRAYTRNLL